MIKRFETDTNWGILLLLFNCTRITISGGFCIACNTTCDTSDGGIFSCINNTKDKRITVTG